MNSHVSVRVCVLTVTQLKFDLPFKTGFIFNPPSCLLLVDCEFWSGCTRPYMAYFTAVSLAHINQGFCGFYKGLNSEQKVLNS